MLTGRRTRGSVDVGHIVGFTIDALTRRLISLAIERYGEPPVPWAWLALGSAARQEQALHTDQDHALAYDLQGRTREEVDPYFADLAEFVTAGFEDAGIPRCDGDAMAANSALRKSIEGWTDAYKGWMTDPGVEGSVLLSIVFDYRRVMGPLDAEVPLDVLLRSCKRFPNFLRHLSRRALDEKPPTGFRKDLVVESKGQHAGRLDIKHKGIAIVGNLARAASIGAGLPRSARSAGCGPQPTPAPSTRRRGPSSRRHFGSCGACGSSTTSLASAQVSHRTTSWIRRSWAGDAARAEGSVRDHRLGRRRASRPSWALRSA